MCSFSQSYINKGMRLGRQEGIRLGEKRGIKKGLQQGRELGMQQGIQQGSLATANRINALNQYLSENKQYDDLTRSFSDKEYQDMLLKKYAKFLNPKK